MGELADLLDRASRVLVTILLEMSRPSQPHIKLHMSIRKVKARKHMDGARLSGCVVRNANFGVHANVSPAVDWWHRDSSTCGALPELFLTLG